MPKNKKKFIDKKNAITFHLVHRSQQDPLAADENAPQHVLLATTDTTQPQHTKGAVTKHREEQHKFGIYFDDDYDYLQHLRNSNSVAVWEQASEPTNQDSKLTLPSSVFASKVEEDVGLLNRAAPQSGLRLDLDPDIVAAMDDDFNYSDPENELEDNFIKLANGLGSDEKLEQYFKLATEATVVCFVILYDCVQASLMHNEINMKNLLFIMKRLYVMSDDEYEEEDEEEDYLSSENDEVNSLRNEDTKSRFTEYSMTSSVIHRNQQLTLLDDRFEQMMAGYDDMEIGALDCDEIEGDIDAVSDLLLQLAEDVMKDKPHKFDTEGNHLVDPNTEAIEEEEIFVPILEKECWDCESVLTTYSNLYNHPKLITEPQINKIRINRKTGIPMSGSKLTAKNLASLGGQISHGPGSIVSAISALSIRNREESLEEKKARKQALKQYRKERRAERKLNTEAFKEEKKHMEKTLRNNKVCSQAVHF